MSAPINLATEKILARVEGGVGWLTLNNPARRNAISLEMWLGISEAIDQLAGDTAVRVIVMHGAGGKSFAAGADISEFEKQRSNKEQKAAYAQVANRGYQALQQLRKPLIAMIDGFCIGGGLAVALHADLRFASDDAQLGIPAAKLGLGYDYAGLASLARLVGPATAKDMLFSARFLGAAEALSRGLVNFVVPKSELERAVTDYAAQVAANAPMTIRAAKEAVRLFETYSGLPEQQDSAIAALVNACFDSADYREGRQAFMEKRAAFYTGT